MRYSSIKEVVLMNFNTTEILTELVRVTEAGSSKARLVDVALKVASEVNIDLAGQDLVEHCQVVCPSRLQVFSSTQGPSPD